MVPAFAALMASRLRTWRLAAQPRRRCSVSPATSASRAVPRSSAASAWTSASSRPRYASNSAFGQTTQSVDGKEFAWITYLIIYAYT
ncbi:unnamed protein product [Symbiodinium natans]|uniref:Uncharacterized protein n=1 Tax=Symbiodinium natans TaxID=878477 RepID=A0A812J2P7_9DINO|nr:unnamed protein product [Symbiodinium natans]